MKMLIALALSIFAASSRGESVGHAEVAIADPWVVLTSYLTKLSYDNGLLVIPVHNKVFYIPGPNGVPKAVLMVTGTETRISGKVQWLSEVCPDPRPKYFSQDYGSNNRSCTSSRIPRFSKRQGKRTSTSSRLVTLFAVFTARVAVRSFESI